MKNGLTV